MRRLRLTAAALWRHVWRSVAASAAMALVLAVARWGWAPAPDDGAVAALATGTASGAAVYGVALFVLWVASGCPDGAERDLAALVSRLARRGMLRAGRLVSRR